MRSGPTGIGLMLCPSVFTNAAAALVSLGDQPVGAGLLARAGLFLGNGFHENRKLSRAQLADLFCEAA